MSRRNPCRSCVCVVYVFAQQNNSLIHGRSEGIKKETTEESTEEPSYYYPKHTYAIPAKK